MCEKGIRVSLDDRNEKIGYKIREARQTVRPPYMVIIGSKEIETNTISVRDRATDMTTTMNPDEFIAKIEEEIINRQ